MLPYLEAPVSILRQMAGIEHNVCIGRIVDSFGESCQIRLEEAVNDTEYNPLVVYGPFSNRQYGHHPEQHLICYRLHIPDLSTQQFDIFHYSLVLQYREMHIFPEMYICILEYIGNYDIDMSILCLYHTHPIGRL